MSGGGESVRRKRSEMSHDDCLQAMTEFAKRIQRMGESSGGGMFGEFAPDGQLGVHFLVNGSFGVSSELFEAVRVLAGHKLPRKV